MRDILFVFLGGGIGSVFRYFISRWLNGSTWAFPLATFLVNISGCFLIGFIFSALGRAEGQMQWKLLLITGFCGGFTTFSTFSLENFQLLNSQQLLTMFVYIALSVALGLAAAWLGVAAGRGL